MAKKKTDKKNMSATDKAAIGVGLTAAAVAAAGAYFLYGSPNAAKNRKKVKSWTLKAKAEVLEALEKAEAMTEVEFNQLVDMVGKTYSTVQGATRGEIADFKKEMKDNWQKLQKSSVAKQAKKAVKNVVKKATGKKVKKTVKKNSKKTTKKTSGSKTKSAASRKSSKK